MSESSMRPYLFARAVQSAPFDKRLDQDRDRHSFKSDQHQFTAIPSHPNLRHPNSVIVVISSERSSVKGGRSSTAKKTHW